MPDFKNEQNRAAENKAPVPTSDTSKNLGGKTVENKSEGGTVPKDKTKENKEDSKVEKEDDGSFKKVIKNEDGTETIIRAASEEEVNQAQANLEKIPEFVNETARQFGVPGLVDLTQGGTLQGDMSKRPDIDDSEREEQFNEIAASKNPTPNRIGNEITKAMEGFSPFNVLARNQNFQETIDDILDNDKNISKDTREQLINMRKNFS